MSRGLKVAEPPRRRSEEKAPAATEKPVVTGRQSKGGSTKAVALEKFAQVQEDEKVQFNKRITRGVADGYEMLAIKTRRKVPELLAEALELLEEKYGRV